MRAKEKIYPADTTVNRWVEAFASQVPGSRDNAKAGKKYFPTEDILCYTITMFGLDKTHLFCVIEQHVFPNKPLLSSSTTSLIIKFGL